ncbi:MAG: PAS domain S-box protein [Symploca sp. SIO2C1]|nr:PAS domain S-box protein [Symploca sp. SIO2C1]
MENEELLTARQLTSSMQINNFEERLRSILNTTTESVILADLQGIILVANETFAQRLGKRIDEIIGMCIYDLFLPKLPNLRKVRFDEVVQTRSPIHFEDRWNGIRLDNLIYPVFDAQGKVARFAVFSRDITEHQQAEESLKQSEEKFHQFAEHIRELFWMYDPILGITKNIINHKQAEEAVRKLNEELGITVAERTIYLGSAIEKLQQEIVRRKQVEDALRATQERFQYLIASNPAIIYSCHPDGDYPTTFVSENSKDILGYTTQEWLADPKFWVNRIHPEDAPRIFANLSPLFEEGRDIHEYRFLHKNGTYRWLRDEAKLVRDEAGCPLEMIGSIVDISPQKHIEQELQASQQKYKTLFEILPIGVSITDKVGNIIEANPASEEILEILGVQQNHLVDRTNKGGKETRRLEDKGNKVLCTNTTQYQQQIIRPDGKPIVASEFACKRALKENKTIQNVEMGVVKPEQETTWLSVTAAPIPLKDYGVAIAYVDITERKKVERMKDEFLAIASHELRTPLTSLRGSLGLLATERLGNLTEQGQQLLEFALLDTERLVRLVNDILDLKRLKFGKNVITPSICQTLELIEQVMQVMQPIADYAGVKLSVARISTPVLADRDRIIQVLTNLLNNAIKFSPPGSTVWLSAEPGEIRETRETFPIPNSQFPNILFKVKDQGRGIPSDQLEKIFEPFRQVNVSDSPQKEGTGLGLAICRSIVQQHGGRIWVESTPGVGSIFYFTLAMSPEKSL